MYGSPRDTDDANLIRQVILRAPLLKAGQNKLIFHIKKSIDKKFWVYKWKLSQKYCFMYSGNFCR